MAKACVCVCVRVCAHVSLRRFCSIHISVRQVLNDVSERRSRNCKSSKGWCLHGLHLALYTLLYTESFEKAMEVAIMAGGTYGVYDDFRKNTQLGRHRTKTPVALFQTSPKIAMVAIGYQKGRSDL